MNLVGRSGLLCRDWGRSITRHNQNSPSTLLLHDRRRCWSSKYLCLLYHTLRRASKGTVSPASKHTSIYIILLGPVVSHKICSSFQDAGVGHSFLLASSSSSCSRSEVSTLLTYPRYTRAPHPMGPHNTIRTPVMALTGNVTDRIIPQRQYVRFLRDRLQHYPKYRPHSAPNQRLIAPFGLKGKPQ